MAGKTTVTHPDGTVSKRTSITRTYTHAIELATPRSVFVADARKAIARSEHRIAEYQAALADGTITRERSQSYNGDIRVTVRLGGVYAGMYWIRSGETEQNAIHYVNDDAARSIVARYLADETGRMESTWLAGLAKAEAMPDVTYQVFGWSQNAKNAANMLRSKPVRHHVDRGATARVVEVDQT